MAAMVARLGVGVRLSGAGMVGSGCGVGASLSSSAWSRLWTRRTGLRRLHCGTFNDMLSQHHIRHASTQTPPSHNSNSNNAPSQNDGNNNANALPFRDDDGGGDCGGGDDDTGSSSAEDCLMLQEVANFRDLAEVATLVKVRRENGWGGIWVPEHLATLQSSRCSNVHDLLFRF